MDITVSDRVIRISAGALLVGALLEAIGTIGAIPADGVGSSDRTVWVLIHLALLIGSVALLLGFPGLYLSQAREIGQVGLIGGILVFVGILGLGFFVAGVQTILEPWVYDKGSCTLGCHLLSTSDGPPLYSWFLIIEALATLVGLIVLGLSIARARIATAAGYLMALGGILGLPMIFISVAPIVAAIPVLIALVAVAWIALRFLTGDAAPG